MPLSKLNINHLNLANITFLIILSKCGEFVEPYYGDPWIIPNVFEEFIDIFSLVNDIHKTLDLNLANGEWTVVFCTVSVPALVVGIALESRWLRSIHI